ncbi:MAG: cell division protein SepF [Bacillota bacterium]|nr:cell division protein SepF [Bacillota bacterium]
MSGFIDKVGNFFFKNEEDMEDELSLSIEDSAAPKAAAEPKPSSRGQASVPSSRKPNLISVPTKAKSGEGNTEIVLFKATSYDDMQEIARHIKERKVAVVNFEDMDKDVAQRMVDFLSGATFALDGAPRKVSGGTFIFSSSQVDVSGQIMSKEGVSEGDELVNDSRFSSNQWKRS